MLGSNSRPIAEPRPLSGPRLFQGPKLSKAPSSLKVGKADDIDTTWPPGMAVHTNKPNFPSDSYYNRVPNLVR